MPGEPVRYVVTSALEARAALLDQGPWSGDLALLDAALEAVGEADPLVITIDGHPDLRVVAVGTSTIATAALTPGGVRAATYVRDA